ncbi:MAG: TetR/AcrR family transcriptional regulator [Candidatus Marinimicrobia bacterium]|nr:TetR/AcrR family transcriptional regulator [Candidatus Neomarinimicrobiota bacterium]TFB10475.1 TetR/AcrR family transcriptional regulator [Candidatus Marinimicrobia bacterium MT.SAG.2]
MPSRVTKSDKRTRIINAALTVFSRDGFQNSKIEDIARAADIGKGTLYEYFSSKDELFLEVFTSFKESVLSKYWVVLDDGDDPLSQLKMMAIICAEICADEKTEMKFLAQFSFECLSRKEGNKLSELLNEYNEEIAALISGIIKEGIEDGLLKPLDVAILSKNYADALFGMLMRYQLSGDKISLLASSQLLFDVFLKGAGTFSGRYVDRKE